MMGMFSKLVSSFVGAGNAEGIEQLAAVIERGQEGVVAAEEEWDEEEFHDAGDGAVQMRALTPPLYIGISSVFTLLLLATTCTYLCRLNKCEPT